MLEVLASVGPARYDCSLVSISVMPSILGLVSLHDTILTILDPDLIDRNVQSRIQIRIVLEAIIVPPSSIS